MKHSVQSPLPTAALALLALAFTLPITITSANAAERAIDKEIVVAATLDATWAAWTTREGIVSFFAPDAVVDARAGGAFHIHINPLAEPGLKGADDMRFLAVQPKQMITFDWNAPPHLPEARAQRTVVIVRFAAVDDKTTKLTLHHVGWGTGGEWDKSYAYFDRAWGSVLGNLKKRFETGPIDWTQWLAQLKKMRDDAAAKKP
jgi:uncharacterized protein YndB with AHSA1/START domain